MIKKFKSFSESDTITKILGSVSDMGMPVEKKFEYIEDLFVSIEDLGYGVKYEIGYVAFDQHRQKTVWYTEPKKHENELMSIKVSIKPPPENTLGIEFIYQNDVDRYIKFQKKLTDIYEKAIISNIHLSGSYTLNGSMYIIFSE